MLIRRRLYGALQSHLAKKEITLLVGARQVGKTTLMKALRDELHGQGVPVLFLNLDIHSDRVHFLSQEALIQKIRLEFGVRRGVVFIDEIQRLTNAGLFLKGLYDMDLPVKFVVSGSGSLELKEKIRESLVGRKRLFELYPVSLAEFLDFRTGYRYSDRLPAWAELDAGAAHSFLLEYLNFGGYPRVVVEGEAREKKLLLQEIFQSYLEKDISDLLNLARPDAFILLIRLLADCIGTPLNFSQLANQTGLSLPTLKKYLWYAEKTFVLKQIPPFFRNARKELVKAPEVFFVDLGLRNYALNQLGLVGEPYNSGAVFENLVFLQLNAACKAHGGNLKFWRTHDMAEVDFVIDFGDRQIPVEVKYQPADKIKISRSFFRFLEKYEPEHGLVVTLSGGAQRTHAQTPIHLIPWSALLQPADLPGFR